MRLPIRVSRHYWVKYKPWWPSGKIVRTRGEINNTALVVFWLNWVLEVEL